MKKLHLTAFLFILYMAVPSINILHADEYYTIIAEIDPDQAKKIVQTLLQNDLAECMEIMRSIGKMSDPKITELIKILCDNYADREKTKEELMLRLLFESVFDTKIGENILSRRILQNKLGLDYAFRKMSNFSDPVLKGTIIGLVPSFFASDYSAPILKEGFAIVNVMDQNNGKISHDTKSEIIDILSVINIIGEREYMDLCIGIMHVTADIEIYSKAKSVLRHLTNK
jgi:hypothetical protein